MKFLIDYTNKPEQRTLKYVIDEYSFDSEPLIVEVNFSVVLNKINLTVNENNQVIQVWGFCPHAGWIKTNCNIPKYNQGILKVVNDLEAGFSYKINDEDWPVYVNPQIGWVCIGNYQKLGSAVEFVSNCIAVVGSNSDLLSLWLKPQNLPSEV